MRLGATFKQFVQYLLVNGYNAKTIKEYERFLYGSLSHSISEKEIKNLKLDDVMLVLKAGERHGKYGPQKSAITLRKLMKYLEEHGHRMPFRWQDVGVPAVPLKKIEFLTQGEINKIRKAIGLGNSDGLRTRVLFETLLATGMRISEALAMNIRDIDWIRREAQVINAKTGEWGWVYFTPRCIRWIKKYLHSRKDNNEALFVNNWGDRLLSVTARASLTRHLSKMVEKKHVHHHIFRKTFITMLCHNGVDIKTVQVLARHKSERTTLRHYAGTSDGRAKDMHLKALSNL